MNTKPKRYYIDRAEECMKDYLRMLELNKDPKNSFNIRYKAIILAEDLLDMAEHFVNLAEKL